MADSPKHHHKDKLKEKKSRKKLVEGDAPASPTSSREPIAPLSPPEVPAVTGEYRIDALSCPIDFVTVYAIFASFFFHACSKKKKKIVLHTSYSDRAEVTRLVKHPLQKGAQQLIIYGICSDGQ